MVLYYHVPKDQTKKHVVKDYSDNGNRFVIHNGLLAIGSKSK
jgi:hypothetical protein